MFWEANLQKHFFLLLLWPTASFEAAVLVKKFLVSLNVLCTTHQ